jgi:hypothetical protein
MEPRTTPPNSALGTCRTVNRGGHTKFQTHKFTKAFIQGAIQSMMSCRDAEALPMLKSILSAHRVLWGYDRRPRGLRVWGTLVLLRQLHLHTRKLKVFIVNRHNFNYACLMYVM